jgi:hypothetical protein
VTFANAERGTGTDADDLFIATLDDLAARSMAGRTEYDVLGIAALLRKLLIDGSRLVDQVNRSHQLRLRFRANRRLPPTDPSPIFWSIQDGLDPETAMPSRGIEPQDMTRDEFLSVKIIHVAGTDLTVGEVVGYLANAAGAVHLGQPRTPKEAALAEVESTLQIGGYPPALRSLLAISRVTVKALQPLRSAILLTRGNSTDAAV